MPDPYQATLGFNDHQVAELAARAITPEQAAAAGVIGAQSAGDLPPGAPAYWATYLPGLLFPLVSPTPGVPIQYQLKPDVARDNEDGTTSKYLFPQGFHPVLHAARIVPGAMRSLLVEGTHQVIAAAIYAPPECSVYGISGCWSWQSGGQPTDDLLALAGVPDAVVILDADAASNLQVYEAGLALGAELAIYGVESVKFGVLPGRGKDGLDDVLAKRALAVRPRLMELLVRDAIAKPSPTKPTAAAEAKRQAAAARERRQEEEAATDAETGLVRFDISRPKAVVIGELVATLADRLGGDALFNRGNVLTMREGDVLKVVSKDILLDAVSQLVRPGHENKVTGVWEESWPDLGVQGVTLQRYDSFPLLEQVVRSPFVRADGTVCQRNGYDPDSRTYVLMEPGLEAALAVPEEPTEEDVRAAVKLLLEDWLVDFPFPTDADRANVLAWMITPFVRGQVDVVPIAVIDGNGPSAGKGLLAELFARLVLGHPMIPSTLPVENDEVRKAITSAMIGGSSVLIWDEAHVLEGTALAMLLTAPVWRDRKLGVSEMATIPNRVTFAALGNNVTVNGDVGRRAYRIRIHPTMERPADRDVASFRHPDIKRWTEDHRAELLGAVLTLVRSWHVAGRPAGPGDLGSFEQWSRMVGGILLNAGVPGFLAGRREWLAHSNDTVNTWELHLAWLHSVFGSRPFRSQEAAERLARAGMDAPLPGTTRTLASPEGTAAYSQALGRAYAYRVDQTHGGLTFHRAGLKDGYQRWWVSQPTEDKSVIGTFTPNKDEPMDDVDKSVSYVNSSGVSGDSRDLSTPTRGENFSPVSRSTSTNLHTWGEGGVGIPGYPTSPTEADPDRYLVEAAQSYTSMCENGHEEILVDGLWYACPICHPATARVV